MRQTDSNPKEEKDLEPSNFLHFIYPGYSESHKTKTKNYEILKLQPDK